MRKDHHLGIIIIPFVNAQHLCLHDWANSGTSGEEKIGYVNFVFEYLDDWHHVFAEFARALKPGGVLVFSLCHPAFDIGYFKPENYFEEEVVTETWRGFGGEPVTVTRYRRSLTQLFDALLGAGFMLERLLEPQPVEGFREREPDHYDELMAGPGFLCIRARLGGR